MSKKFQEGNSQLKVASVTPTLVATYKIMSVQFMRVKNGVGMEKF